MSRFLIVLMMGLGLYGQTLPDLTVASISTANVTTDTQSLLVSGTLGVTVRNLGAPVATVFRVVAWEDRDGNGVLNAGTDVTLGSAGSNGTIATGASVEIVIPIAGVVSFRGNRIYVKADSGESIAESNESNNVLDSGGRIGTPTAPPFQLTTLSTGFNSPVGIDYHVPSKRVILSVNYSSGTPFNFELIDFDGSRTQFSSISGLGDEVKIATAKDDGGGKTIGGFTAGEFFTGSGVPGVVVRVSPDGKTIRNPWVTLPGESGLMRGSLYVDRTGVFGGDLIVVTTTGGVWRVKENGQATKLASLNTWLEGLSTIPNDPGRYGPWAGKILIGAEQQTRLYAVDSAGVVTPYNIGIEPEDIDLIPANENFFGVAYGNRTLMGAPASMFSEMVGDILITQESPGILYRVRWNGSAFEKTELARTSQWEHVTFAPVGIKEIGSTELPDFTSSLVRKDDARFPASVQLTARIGNGGARTLATVSNRLVNGDAEGQRGGNGVEVIPPTGWTTTGEFTSVSYATANGWPTASSPGSPTRKLNFFAGGQVPSSIARQSIALACPSSALSPQPFSLSGWIGGFEGQEDNARVRAVFRDSTSKALAEFQIGPVTRADRGSVTSLLRREITGDIPLSSASVEIVIELTRLEGVANDGYVDDVAFSTNSCQGAGTSSVGVTFYRGDPASGGSRIGTANTNRPLGPSEYEDVSITWNNPTAGLHPIVVVADDNGAGVGVIAESDETNNKAGANILLGVGPFPLVDSLLTRFKDKAVDLEWAAVPGAASYTLYRRSGSGSLSVVQRGLLTTRFSDANLTNGTAYSYVVRWVNGAGLESADGTEASAIPTPDVRTDGTPPTILSNPLTRARALARYSYQVAAGDPDPGEVLTYSLTSAPAGMTISGTGLIEWTPSLQQFGYFNVTVRVQDRTLKAATQTFRLFTEVEIINNAPVIISSAISRGASGETYSYRVLARDPDAGDLLTYSLVAGPTGMSMNPATGLISWLPTRQQVASHPVTVQVTDLGGLRAEQSFTILVARGNTAPRFTSLPVTFTRAGSGYRYQPTAMDAESDPLTFKLDSVVPAAAITVDGAAGTVAWAVPTGAAGTAFEVTIRVTDDGGLSATQAYRITVGAANLPPVISSTAVTTAVANVSYRYAVTATDPNLPDEVLTYSLVIAPVGMTIAPLTGVIDWVPGAPLGGTNVNVAVRVTDQLGLTATQTFVVAVRPPDLTRPAVSLLGPANGSTLTNDAPVTGTVTDDNLRLWRVEYRTVDAPDWRVLSTGTTNVPTVGSLGTFPATLLANDVYRMRLYAEDAGGSVTSPEIEVTIDTKQLKMGDFTLTYEDLRLPAGSFPISIFRKYDTKRPQVGDFGPGWTLGFNEVDVRIDVNKSVFLTLPDGRRVGFAYTPTCLSVLLGACLFGAFETKYTAPPGVYDTLTNLDCPQTIAGTCGFFPFEPKDWVLTAKGGVKYTIRSGKIVRMEDPAGNWIDISSDGVRSSAGRNIAFQRDGAGKITAIGDPKLNSLRYEYDATGRLSKFTDQLGNATTYDYLAASHLVTAVNAPGGCAPLRNQYGPDGRVTSKADPSGNVFKYSYNISARTTTVTNPKNFTQVTEFDNRGNTIADVDGLGNRTVYTYDERNNRLTTTFPSGRRIVRTFSPNGNVLSESAVPGTGVPLTTTYSYNKFNQVESITRQGGEKTVFEYDGSANLVRRDYLDASGALVRGDSFSYDGFGKRTAAVDGDGKETRYTYDRFGSITARRDPTGAVVRYEYDANGNNTAVVDPSGLRLEFDYNAMNLVAEARQGGQTISRRSYNEFGDPVNVTDALGRVTSFSYSCLGDLVRVTDPSGQTITYDRDSVSNLSQVTNQLGRQTRFAFDAANRQISRTTSDGGLWGFDWTADGVLRKESSPNEPSAAARELDPYGRISTLSRPGESFSYSYDSNGRVIRVAKQGGEEWAFSYDGAGQLRSATAPPNGRAISYEYNRRGLRSSMTTPDGWTTTYAYDDAGRVINIATGTSSARFTYDTAGRRTRVLYSNGASTNYTYDPQGRLNALSIQNASGVVVSSYGYTLDLNGNRIATRFGDGNGTFALDSLGRLASENITSTSLGAISRNYSYDGAGNRLGAGVALGLDSRLLSDAGGGYTYDANGNRTARGAKRYGYDSANRIVSFTEGATVASYQYDFTGRRVSKTVNGSTTQFLNDGDNVAVEYPPSGASVRYTHGLGIDEVLMQTRGAQSYFYHADALGSIVAITDGSGNVVQRYGYDAWGNIVFNSGAFSFSTGNLTNRMAFTGREWDAESGLYHFRARAYDPLAGRFLQKDPLQGSLANPASQNSYAYAHNNPLNLLDPYGEFVLIQYAALLDGNDLTKGAFSAIGGLVGFGIANLQFIGEYLALGDRGDLSISERWERAVDLTESALKNNPLVASQISFKGNFLDNDACIDSSVNAKLSVGGGLVNAFVSGEGPKLSAFEKSVISIPLVSGKIGASISVKLGGFKCGLQVGVGRLRALQPR